MPKVQESAQREEAACFARRRARCKPSPAISMPRPSPKLKLLPCAIIGDESSECGEALALLGSHTFVEGEGTGHTSRSSPTQPVAPIEGCSDSPRGRCARGELASTPHLGAVVVALIAAAVRVAVALVAVGVGARRLALGLLQASWRWRRRLARWCWRRRKEEGGRREPGGIRIGPAGDRAARRRDLRRAVVAVAVVTAAVRVSVCSVAVGVGAPRRAFGRRRRRGRWHCHRRWR